MKIIYTNENYQVLIAKDKDGYDIRNTDTDVIEDNSKSLPHALAQAEQMNRILLQEEWKKYAEQMYPNTSSNVVDLNVINPDTVN